MQDLREWPASREFNDQHLRVFGMDGAPLWGRVQFVLQHPKTPAKEAK